MNNLVTKLQRGNCRLTRLWNTGKFAIRKVNKQNTTKQTFARTQKKMQFILLPSSTHLKIPQILAIERVHFGKVFKRLFILSSSEIWILTDEMVILLDHY